MSNLIAINYDETVAFAKQFRDEGDDIVQLYSNTRQRVDALRSEWIGDAAEAFYEEMEAELLPALQRVSGALFLCDEVLLKIMKIIHEADEETSGFFKDGLNTDFGAGLFGLAGAGLAGAVGANLGSDDFGAGKFEDALGGDKPAEGTPPTGEVPASQQSAPEAQQQAQASETPPAETGGGGGSAGGGDSGNHGIQGDLKGLGTGVGNQVEQQIGAASSNQQNIPDHIFSGAGSTENVSPMSPAPAGTPVVPGEQASPSGGIATAAGAAGVAGAAVVGSKVLKENQDQSE